jgi:hypothetical protein
VNAVIKFQVPKFPARWLDSSAINGISRSILLHGVKWLYTIANKHNDETEKFSRSA